MKIIKTEGQVKVVELVEAGELKRRILPFDSEDAADVELGIPYGLPVALLLERHGLDSRVAQRIEQELHRAGLWTAADIHENPRAVQGAIQAAYGVDTATLLNLVRQFPGGN